MAKFGIYRNYRFIDKDPLCDALRTVIRSDSHLNNNEAARISGVAATTIHGWLDGATRRPQNATATQLAASLGYVRRDTLSPSGQVVVGYERVSEIDPKVEMKKQADWLLRQDRKKKPRKRKAKSNGHG